MKINSVAEFVKTVCELQSNLRQDGIHHEIPLFRGQSNSEYELVPAIGRGRGDAYDITIMNEERNLIEMAKYKMPNVFHNGLRPIELLSLLQHYGIPTRLLDVTENALVALFFACYSNYEKDGEVIVFKYDETDVTNYPVINAIADSYRFSPDSQRFLALFYKAVTDQEYFDEQRKMLEITCENDEDGGKWIAECCEKILFLYAPNNTLRQQLQSGRYILFPNRITKENDTLYFEKVIDSIPKNHENIIRCLTIDKNFKGQILKDLNMLGINKEKLFYDSVDVVCEGIKDYFEKKRRGYTFRSYK